MTPLYFNHKAFGSEVRKFYVYIYLRDTASKNGTSGSPYYVGKGQGQRAWQNKSRSINLPSSTDNIKIIATGINEINALQLEVLLVHLYGRIDLRTGVLHNKTAGGEGRFGSLISQEDRAKRGEILRLLWQDENNRRNRIAAISIGSKRRKYSIEARRRFSIARRGIGKGRVVSEETRQKLSQARKAWLEVHRAEKKEYPHEKNHGTPWYYSQGCRCDLCKKAVRGYRQKLKLTNAPMNAIITT